MDPEQYDPNRGSQGFEGSDPAGSGGQQPTSGQQPGAPAGGGGQPGGYGNDPNRDYRRRNEKEDEKEQEKRQEKGQGLDEKYHRDPLGFVSWVLIIIWLGVTLLLQNLDVGIFDDDGDKGWAIFFWGGAVIIFAEAFLRVMVPRWRRSLVGSFVWGAVWAGVGFGLWFDKWEVIGPIILIAVGVAILLGRIVPRR